MKKDYNRCCHSLLRIEEVPFLLVFVCRPFALSNIGYTEATAFAPDVVEGIFNIATLVPALGFLLLSMVLWFWYPLHKKQVAANVAALKEKHGE